MQTKIHNLREYTPAEIESFRARMEAHRARTEEYDEDCTGWLAAVVCVMVGLIIGAVLLYAGNHP